MTGASAAHKDGVLEVRTPKPTPEAASRGIEIQQPDRHRTFPSSGTSVSSLAAFVWRRLVPRTTAHGVDGLVGGRAGGQLEHLVGQGYVDEAPAANGISNATGKWPDKA